VVVTVTVIVRALRDDERAVTARGRGSGSEPPAVDGPRRGAAVRRCSSERRRKPGAYVATTRMSSEELISGRSNE
jgi:hypothetical protein